MDSIFQVAFGVDIDSLCGSNEEGSKFAEAFDDSSALIMWRYVDISWKIKKLLNIGSEAVLKKRIQVVDDFVYKVIYKKRKQHDLVRPVYWMHIPLLCFSAIFCFYFSPS